jgi:hypothetical protein
MVIVQPGVYYESVESIRNGLPDAPIIIHAAFLGTVMIQPPVDSVGINIQPHYHIVDGLVVTGGTQGIQMGPHYREDWIVGVVAQNNEVYGNSGNGIELRRTIDGVVAFNTAYANGGSGPNTLARGVSSTTTSPLRMPVLVSTSGTVGRPKFIITGPMTTAKVI